MGSGKTTSFDIAHLAGVSQATVSRALRDSELVNPKTRERIKRIARELNYQVDRAASGLRSQSSNTLALLLFEDPTSDDSQINPFFLSMLGNVTRAAAKRNFDLLVSFQQLSDNWHIRYEVSNRADGIILLGYGAYSGFADKVERLVEADAHFVIWGASGPHLSGHSIACDNIHGASEACSHLVGLDRKNIAFIGNKTADSPEFKQRYEGYSRALSAAGLPIDPGMQFDADNQESSGAAAALSLIESGKPFDAIFTASDLIAIGAIRQLRKAGLKVPEDISVVGFDDIPAASYLDPALTTIHQDTITAGEMLVDQVIRMINGETPESRLVTPNLVVRDSCGGKPSGVRSR